jgi:hypothetical protein
VITGKLMEIYNGSRLNDGEPDCIFAETLIFNEGWLLRGVLERWRRSKGQSKFAFLPFPDNIKIYSEAQLFTPFKRRLRIHRQGEGNTHVDGIVGSFSFSNIKSGVVLDNNCEYLAVFEAKMYSGLAGGVKHIGNYSQVSRTLACMVNSVLKRSVDSIHFAVIYPEDSKKIDPTKYTRSFIEGEIEERLRGYKQSVLINRGDDRLALFEKQWKSTLRSIDIEFITWEDILSELGDQDIDRFYELCKKHNG